MAAVFHHARRLWIGTTAEMAAVAAVLGADSVGTKYWDTTLSALSIWDGSAWQGIGAGGVLHNTLPDLQGGQADQYYHLTNAQHTAVELMVTAGLDALTQAEVDQLENIGATTINATQWGHVGAMDQGVATGDSPTFAGITIADGGAVGQAAGPLLIFDDTLNYLEITGCTLSVSGDIDPAASGQDLGNATHLWDLHVRQVYFGAATGFNFITIPDGLADALEIMAGPAGDEYIGIRTAAQKAVVVNEGGVDIDYRVEASGVADAFQVQGSDGQITLGALGAGHLSTDASGVIASSADITMVAGATVDGLDLSELGTMLFNEADGLLLLGPDGEINPTEWWSLRKQLATLSGAFHQEAGRWQGTKGLVVEVGATNLCENPSFEVNITDDWTCDARCTRVSTRAKFGDYSVKLETTGVANAIAFFQFNVTSGVTYVASGWVYLESGLVYLDQNDKAYEDQVATAVANKWVRLVSIFTPTATETVTIRFFAVAGSGTVAYLDGVQLEARVHPTSYCDGTLGSGYAWTGTAHNSTSTRAVNTAIFDDHVGLISNNATLSFRVVLQMPYDAAAAWPPGPYIWAAKGADYNNRIILHFNPPDDKIYLYINGANRCFSAAQTWKAGQWLDIIVTLDFTADDYNLYINGILEDNDTTALTAPILTAWAFGSAAGTLVGGFVYSEYAVFDRVLTAVEVANLHALQRPLVDSGSLDGPHVSVVSGAFGRSGGAIVRLTDIGNIEVADAHWIGNSATTARLVFNSSGATDYAYFLGCYVGIGTTSPLSELQIESSGPRLTFLENDGAANNQIWDFVAAGEQFRGRVINDAYNTYVNWLQVDRTGTTVDYVSFPGGNVGIGKTPAVKLDVAGSVRIDGDEGGLANTLTLTDATNTGGAQIGWLKIYLGATEYCIPYHAVAVP